MEPVHVVVITRNDLICNGIRTIVHNLNQKIDHISAFASATEYEECVRKTGQKASILLLDDSSSNVEPLPIIHQLTRRYPQSKIVVISNMLNHLYIQHLLDSGVAGFLYMQDHLEDLFPAFMRTVLDDKVFLSPQASALPYHRIEMQSYNKTDRAVLELMASGHKPGEIAERLNVAPRTIYRVRRKLRDSLNVRTTEQIVEAARKRGLLKWDN